MAELSVADIIPWKVAKRAFRPANANPSDPFQRLSDARAFAGFVMILVVSFPYIDTDTYNPLSERYFNLLAGYAATSATAAIAALLVAIFDPATRGAARKVLLRATLPILIPAMVVAYWRYTGWKPSFTESTNGGFVFLVVIAIILLLVWINGFVPFMVVYCLRWVFGVGEVKQYLPPVVSSVAAGVAYWIDMTYPIGGDLRPSAVQAFLKIGTLVTVTGLSIIELTAMRGDKRRVKRVATAVGVVASLVMASLAYNLPDPRDFKPPISTARASGPMFRTDQWAVTLSHLQRVNYGILADITYRNIGKSTVAVNCPKTSVIALVFRSQTVGMSEIQCDRYGSPVTRLRPDDRMHVQAFFPNVPANRGVFQIRWTGFGTTSTIFAMPS